MLPPLRQELTLHPGPPGFHGAPTWTLHDPAANRFYELSWPAFELLSRWSLGNADALLAAIAGETTLQLDHGDLEAVLQFLNQHSLLLSWRAEDSARLSRIATGQRMSHAMWLLKHYLFFRIPLLRPMPVLKRLAPRTRWVFHPAFWWTIAGFALTGLFLVSRRWDEFTHTFSAYAGLSGLLGIGIALSFAKVLHEFGHALTAYRYGCRVPTMGMAFLVLWPVLYTDTNEAWKLTRREDRLKIGAAGMLAELALAACATLLWSFLPDGPVRAGVFLLATSTWLITLAINASPFMRFDGYFLLSDALNIPNLHERAFAFGRWWLRERLFGFNDPVPEHVTPERQRFLIGFAFATWLYRLVLFFGIALMVYHLFFKALGLAMLAVELGWFIVLPIWRELKQWWQRRRELGWNRATRRTLVLAVVALLVVVLPWRGGVRAPAVLSASESQALYAAETAKLRGAAATEGSRVTAGQLLAQLDSPELDFRLEAARQREAQLRWQVEQQPFADKLQEAGDVLRRRWIAAREEVSGLALQRQQLQVRAPFAGRIVDANPMLADGAWLARGEKLFQLVGERNTLKVEAYVGEGDHDALRPDGGGVFIANLPEFGRIRCRGAHAESVNIHALPQPYLASVHGGPISTVQQQQALVPLEATYRVRLGDCDHRALPAELAGQVTLERTHRSLAGQGWTWLAALWQRERGL
ncbi:HlyD family efflux transporter periplasmic adaptor subunit [Chitinolyticbacter meiyuanensis]|uniref:HlyD family efflux transporter periplasmic adaptor subunit n=1 Tax=Chitinolyticbacter meiyuanensis TaxID=682798 RepID=UPI0011E59879|nr:HlyD family efflux transporter periplasmic adaptor subunit [Chitinolyticbacter meiyuanensis]